MLKRFTQLFAMFLLAIGQQALAASPAEDPEEITVTALRTPVLQSEIIGNQAVLTGDTLEILGPTHIQQALARLPGVNFHLNSGQEYLPAIRSPVLTGPGACGSFLTAEDGIPLRPAGFCNVNELFEAHSEMARRIEVIRGPSVALYGSNALHGVINVVTPEPGAGSDRIAVEYGTEEYYRTRVLKHFDNLSVAFSGTRDLGFRDQAGVDQQKLTLRSAHQLDGIAVSTGATLVNLNQETAGYIEGFEAYKDDDLAESNPNPEAFRDAQAARVWARFSDRRENPSWVVTPYARYSDMDFRMHFLPGTPLEENGQTSVGVQSAIYRTDSDDRWVFGIDGEIVDGWLKQSQDQPTGGSPFLEETIPVGKHYNYTVKAMQLAPFVHWDHDLTERLSFSLGLRYEWMRYDYDNRMLAGRTRDDGTACGFGGCRYSRPADSTDDFHNFSPKLGLSYDLAENHRAYVAVARGFRAPQAVELYRLQRDQQLADLDSERIDSVELGFQGETERLDYELLFYAMKKGDIIFRDTDFFNVSSGKTRHYGVEASLDYRFTEDLSITFTATEARHEYDNDVFLGDAEIDGNYVDGSPRRFSNTVLRWSGIENTTLELEWRHMGSYYTDPENVHEYDGHDLFNLLGETRLTPAVTLNVRVINLADEEYASRADFTTFSGDRYIPGEPRTLFVGVDYRWN